MGDAIEDLFGGLSGGADQVGDAEDDERDDIIDAIIEKKFGKPERQRFGRRKEKKQQEVFQNPMARAADSDEDSEGETEKPKPKRDEDPEEALRQKLQALSPAQLEKAAQIAGVDIRALEAASRTECCGFSLSQRVFVATSTIMPVADAWTDWALIMEWLYKLLYPSADCSVCAGSGSGSFDSGCTFTPGPNCPQLTWLLAGLVIQVLSGAVSGGLLASGSLSKRCGGCGCLVAFIGGMLGIAPMLEAAVTLSDGMHHSTDDQLAEDIWLLKSIRALELVVETLPQSFLQVSIGVMYGMLSPTSLQFNPLLALSVTISLFTAGVTMVGMCGASSSSLGRSPCSTGTSADDALAQQGDDGAQRGARRRPAATRPGDEIRPDHGGVALVPDYDAAVLRLTLQLRRAGVRHEPGLRRCVMLALRPKHVGVRLPKVSAPSASSPPPPAVVRRSGC